MTVVKFCCGPFEEYYLRAGERGFSIVISSHNETPLFRLYMRAVAHGEEQLFAGHAGFPDTTLTAYLPLQYCPFCGKRLKKFYRKTWPDLVQEGADTLATVPCSEVVPPKKSTGGPV